MPSDGAEGPVSRSSRDARASASRSPTRCALALVAGQMRPGVLYSAPMLAGQFGCLATPIREAMLDLVKEGLVVAVRNKGFRVTELSNTELDEISDLRTLIELTDAGEVARRCDAAWCPGWRSCG